MDNSKTIIFGIQGGPGSFNEQALLTYLQNEKIKRFETKYLYTTEKVLKNLELGKVDYGIFAIQNSVGGLVEESVEAMAHYQLDIIKQFSIPIRHCLLKKKGVNLEKVDTIMTHPQVLKQCKATLAQKYPHLKQTSGRGDLIDHAKVARFMGKDKIKDNISTMGSMKLAEINNLDIVETDLQDKRPNKTEFLVVKLANNKK